MTQEEKARAYDEAIRKAKITLGCCGSADIITEHTIYDIFPELAESEDDRIRNGLIALLKFGLEDGSAIAPGFNETKEEALAWLEKQDKQKEYTFKSIPRLLDMIEPTDRAKAYCQKLIDALVKEGYATDAKIIGECLKKMNGEDVAMATMDEQKSDDNIEPKFKIGDWVVSKITGSVYQIKNCIENLSNHKYGYDLTNGGYIGSNQVNHYHLWTIKDAKDGDVLSNGKMIVIFKHFEEPSYRQHIVAYIGLDLGGDIQITDDTWRLGIDKAKPATKEQRDLLFQKMKEAGLEWDSEKKELKTIKQKQGDKVGPKFNVGVWVVNKLGDVWHIDSIDNKNYQTSDGKGNYNYFPISKQDEMRPWTIKDAKDGDTLVTYDIQGNLEWLFLYMPNKHKLHINDPRFYCHYDIKADSFKKDDDYVSVALGTKFCPATKEQCDLLFKKMQKAGYVWDLGKKELKKIHVIDEGKAEMDYCFTKMMNGEKVSPTAWSEEDEKTWKELIEEVKDQLDSVPAPDCRDKEDEKVLKQLTRWSVWLKSIKQRIGGEK